VQASRALLSVGTALFIVYVLAIALYFAKQARQTGSIAVANGPIQYVVTTASGESHVLDNVADDPAAVLVEAGRRFGEVSSVKKLEPGDPIPESAGPSRAQATIVAFVMLTFPLGLLAAGFRARARANEVRALWSAISPTLTAASGPLLARLAINEGALPQVIERLNAEGRVQLVFDAKHKRVYDRRLSDHTITVQFCPRCNEALGKRLIADLLQVPTCPSCMFPVDQAELHHLTADIVRQLRNDGGADAESDFSLGTLVVLALLFPPGAIYYGLNHS
jgi:hypothetical protein